MTTETASAHSRRSILLVEDETMVRSFLGGMLTKAGYTVTAVGNGEEARRELATSKFDIVLCDLDLGDGPSGVEVLREMPCCNTDTPFVILTGHGTVGRCREAFLWGASDFIEKPSSPNAVLAVLERALQESAEDSGVDENGVRAFPADSQGAKLVRRAVKIVERLFSDPDLSVRDLAAQAGVTPEHLARVFKSRTGRTPLEHVHEMRVQSAEKLLRKPGLSVYEIALDCGYRTTSELDEWFRRLRQVTPSNYRASAFYIGTGR